MSDYISREAAIEAMYKDAEAHPGHTLWATQYEALLNIPAADVRPIPKPHGRLIDADAFLRTIRPICDEDANAACTFETVKRLMVEHINNAPTIFPAEEGE